MQQWMSDLDFALTKYSYGLNDLRTNITIWFWFQNIVIFGAGHVAGLTSQQDWHGQHLARRKNGGRGNLVLADVVAHLRSNSQPLEDVRSVPDCYIRRPNNRVLESYRTNVRFDHRLPRGGV
eukprot:6053873-Amphidinium_carterae.1